MIALLYLALTFKATPSYDQFCYPPDARRIQTCYWPNRIDCVVSTPPWKLAELCGASSQEGMTGTAELEEQLIGYMQTGSA